MSHVADGILHAYLDGALDALSDAGELPDGATAADIVSHLHSCADCRARLDAERVIREGAGSVLADAAPLRIAAPPLAGLGAAPRPPGPRWLPLSWAATVLLAVGAGWWGSELWRADSLSRTAVEQSAPRMQDASTAAAHDAAGATAAASSAAAGANPAGPPAADGGGERAAQTRGAADSRLPAPLAAEALPTNDREQRLADPADPADPLAVASQPGQPLASESLRVEPPLAAAPAVPPQPIGAVLADGAGARRDSNAVAASPSAGSARNQVARSQEGPMQPAAAEAVRSLQAGAVPASVGRTEPWTRDAAALKQFTPGFSSLAAFDSLTGDVEAGRSRFESASPAELRRISGQVFTLADASEPSVEVARESGRTIVRVQQTLQSGVAIELISLQQHQSALALGQQAIALEQVIVTGVTERSAREADPLRRGRAAEAQSDTAGDVLPADLARVPGVRTLADGRHQIVLRSSSGSLWVALRAHLTAEELHALLSRLTQPAPR